MKKLYISPLTQQIQMSVEGTLALSLLVDGSGESYNGEQLSDKKDNPIWGGTDKKDATLWK